MSVLSQKHKLPHRPKAISQRQSQLTGSEREKAQEETNAEALKALLAYIKHLYSEGEISDAAYKTLITGALATFVKNSIYFRVEHLLEDIDNALDEVSQVVLLSILS